MSLTAEQPPKDILFEHEEDVLRDALTRLREGESGSGEWPKTYGDLTAEYEALVKAQRRLVRLSDRQQNQLNQLTRKAKDLAEDLKQANELLTGSNRHLEDIQLKLSRYIPRQLLDKILAGEKDVQIGGQRKKLTVFFSDIAGFTEINDRIEPEELTQVLNHYLNEMSGIAVAHGATIDKYIGDAIMGFFGDPSSHGARQDASA
jgi:adenylate cyclase